MSPRQWDLDEDLPQLCRGQAGANDRAMKIVADLPDTPPCGLCGCCLRRCVAVNKNGPRSGPTLTGSIGKRACNPGSFTVMLGYIQCNIASSSENHLGQSPLR